MFIEIASLKYLVRFNRIERRLLSDLLSCFARMAHRAEDNHEQPYPRMYEWDGMIGIIE